MVDSGGSMVGVREAARMLHVHENTVRNWVRNGLLAAVELPGSRYLRFRRDDVARLLKERESASDASRDPSPASGLVGADVLSRLPTRRAQELLPHLVRRLLQVSPGVRGLSVRVGEGITAEGWDAVVLDSTGSPWVPSGESRWELGTGTDPRAKAQKDYDKRTKNALGADRERATFVFATSRRSPALKKWADERRAEAKWKDVQALDADDLEAWLEASPSVQLWLSEEVGWSPEEIMTLPVWWRRFSCRTRPPIPTGLLLAGRSDEADQVRRLVRTDPGSLAVRARSRSEALAFVAAALAEAESEAAAPVVVARSLDAWGRLSRSRDRSTLVPEFEGARVSEALENGHSVVVPLASTDFAGGLTVIELAGLDRQGAREALEGVGLPFDRADELAATACRSFEALMRDARLAWEPFSAPSWAEGDESFVLAPLVLAGSWTSERDDQEIVSEVAGRDWPEVSRLVRMWSRMQDPPIVDAGRVWRLASPEAALEVLGSRLARDDIQRFCNVALRVLSEPDPALGLTLEERLAQGLKGLRPRYSSELRLGICQGVALLAVRGQQYVLEDGLTASEYASRCVGELLERANIDSEGVLWQSLSRELPLLAEAAPDQFLDALNRNLVEVQPSLAKMFHDHGEFPTGMADSPHTGLLWGIELVAWSREPGHLTEAALVLARLDELDRPRGKLGNRPDASLRKILLPWLPQTAASLDGRLAALDQIRKRYPALAWRLEVMLLPHSGDTSAQTTRPRFRAWVPKEQGVPLPEYLRTVRELVVRVIADAGHDSARFSDLVPLLPNLPPEDRETAIAALEVSAPHFQDDDATKALWLDLLNLVDHHRVHSGAGWALDAASVDRLHDVAASLEPSDLVLRSAHLFDWHPPMLDVDRHDHRAWDLALMAAQDAAMTEVLGEGFDSVRRLAEEASVRHLAAASAARVAGDELREAMLPLLGREGSDGELAASWVGAMASIHGSEWARSFQSVIASWPMKRQLKFLLALRPAAPTWELLSRVGDEVRETYWEGVQPHAVPSEDVIYVAERLLEHTRPWAAISVLAGHVHESRPRQQPDIFTGLVLKALDAGVQESPTRERPGSISMATYEVGLLLDHITAAGVNLETVALFEWQYLPLLEHVRDLKALYATLGSDPDLFVQLVCHVYRARNEPQKEADERAAALSQQAWRVLHHWSALPGIRDDGTVDADKLRQWVRKVRFELAERDREVIGDQLVGAVLSTSPVGQDGVWPAEPVRDILEDVASQHLETGLRIGRYNARGVTSRGAYEGGAQELALAKQYLAWAAAVGARWPRTARLLRQLATGYETEARRMDEEARRQETA